MVILMSESRYNGLIAEFDNKISIRDYAEGYKIYDLRRGFSRGKEWKASVFFVIGLGMLFILLMEHFDFDRVPVVAIMLMICMYMCTHYLYLLPKKAKLKGEHIYKSSRLLSKQKHYEFYRDYFIVKNEYEYLKRYYTEITDCIETSSAFVLIGGIESKIIVIAKKGLAAEQCSSLSDHFSKEMIRQYRIRKK